MFPKPYLKPRVLTNIVTNYHDHLMQVTEFGILIAPKRAFPAKGDKKSYASTHAEIACTTLP